MKILYCLFIGLAILSCNLHDQLHEKLMSPGDDLYAAVQTGGIKVITIETPKGKFNVWTKQVGNNPTIKVLLLNGGPGATHEYFECFESFYHRKDLNLFIMTNWDAEILITPKIPACGTFPALLKK